MNSAEKSLGEFIEAYKSFVVVPDTSLDSLIAAGLLTKKLLEHGFDVKISLNAKILVDYPSDPAIVIGLLPVNKTTQLYIGTDNGSSISTRVLLMLDKLVGVDKWDKLIAIIAGLYRGLYDFRSGAFKGAENTLMKELVQDRLMHEITGLRLWGSKRNSLVLALSRTLMPFIPGITGNLENSAKIVSEIFKVQDPYTVRQKELHADESRDRTLSLIKVLAENAKDPQLAFKVLGDFYISLPGFEIYGEVEAHELMGSLVVYESLCSSCPLDVALIPLEKSLIPQIMSVYEDVIDKVASHVAQYFEKAKLGEPVDNGNVLKRPDLLVDVLQYINALPKNKCVKILLEQEGVTTLRELLRIGVAPTEAYVTCGDDQLCPVK